MSKQPNRAKPAEDWTRAEQLYRTGQTSLRAIGEQCGMSEGAIRKRAKRDNWERDLTARVQEQARASLARNPLADPGLRIDDKRTEREIVDEAAATLGSTIRTQRDVAARGLKIGMGLLEELEDLGEQAKAPATLGARAAILEKLANATGKLTATQRDAWGMNDKKPPDELRDLTEAQLMQRLKLLDQQLAKLNGE